MQLGFIGLGKMGGNMVHRIHRDSDHQVVAFDYSADAVSAAEGHGATGASSLEDLVAKLETPRTVWLMVPAGDPTEQTVNTLADLLDEGDTIVDGGNTNWHDDVRRAAALDERGIHYVDVGTSGGVWGLEVGYCMMVGGYEESVQRLAPILDVLAPPDGWRRFGDAGAGHFVKMVHNGVEYGMMQAYAEGFELMYKSKFDVDLKEVAGLWQRGSVVRSWLCELAEKAFAEEGNDLAALKGHVSDSGEGRWTIIDAIDHDVPTPVITASLYARFYSRGEGDYTAQGARRAAQPVRGPRRRAIGMMAVTTTENPLTEGLERLPVPPTTLVDLRRDRRPRAPQAAARALQPRARGRAAGALQPGRRLAPRPDRRRVPRPGARGDRAVLAPQAGRAAARRPRRRGCATSASRSTTRPATRSSARRWTRSTRRPAQPLDRVYYLSTAPEFFGVITEAIRENGLHRHEHAEVRAVIEKPFGTDLASARALQEVVHSVFRERQVFRIDHYLGKETVQNVMAFRFANYMFEPVWNRNYIDHIQITAAEDMGIGTRAGYYDSAGRAARPRAEPHAAAADARVHGAADLVRGEQGARREGQGAAGDRAADARAGRRDDRARALHGRHGRRRARRPATSRRRACRRTRTPRPTRR